MGFGDRFYPDREFQVTDDFDGAVPIANTAARSRIDERAGLAPDTRPVNALKVDRTLARLVNRKPLIIKRLLWWRRRELCHGRLLIIWKLLILGRDFSAKNARFAVSIHV